MLLSFILALFVIFSAATEEGGRIFSRKLAEKEGFELTKIESFVDSYMLILDHITRHKKDVQTFNGDHLLTLLKENRHLPYIKTLEERFQKIHDDSKSTIHTMMGLMSILEGIAEEENIDKIESQNALLRHEHFEKVAQRFGGDKDTHKGQSAFGNKDHLG